jgi:hypothetical protein
LAQKPLFGYVAKHVTQTVRLTRTITPRLNAMRTPSPFSLLTTFLASTQLAHPQAAPTAQRKIDFTAFAGATSSHTGLSAGHNSAVTAGLDLNLPEIGLIRPSLEVRALAPYTRGSVNSEKDILAGPRAELRLGPIHPYFDLLIGRGSNSFVGPYSLFSGGFLYSQPPSTVISPGIGVRVSLFGNLSAIADGQIQHWSTPASLSGHLLARPLTAGLVYRFTWSHNVTK